MPEYNFDYDQEAAQNTKDATKTGNYVQLPFDTPLFSWVRGQAAIKPDDGSGVKHFGGWRCDLENMHQYAHGDIPQRFEPEVFISEDEKQTVYNAYCVRSLAIAPIAQRWKIELTKDRKERPAVHTLAYCAIFDQEKKIYQPWMPVILSVKGWTNKKWLEKAFKDWKDATAAMRTTHANDAPANFFWMHLGTFTDKRMAETVKDIGFVTPPRVFIPPPEKMTVEWLNRAFVGREITSIMGELKIQAKEWLKDWNNRQPAKQESAAAPENTKAQPPKASNLDNVPF